MIKIDFKPKEKQLCQFGWISLFGFPLIGFMIAWNFMGLPAREAVGSTLFFVMLAVGGVTFVLSLIKPTLILPVYVGLMIVALPIGLIISFTLMSLIYYLMVTPLGLCFRLFGRDPLNKSPDPKASSYWFERKNQPTPASYLKQY